MTFEFNNQFVPQNVLEIDEIGETAIEGVNNEGFFYYLVIRTILGTSLIATCGPIIPDISILPNGFNINIDRMQYREDKLARTVQMFLNDKYKKLTEAKIIDYDTAIEQFRPVQDYLRTLNAETI